jgi:predicted RNase H-like nuclease (RuvC/YqgF family)
MSNEDWRETTFARDATIRALNERIRELEAELVELRSRGAPLFDELREAKFAVKGQTARAEKAEARVAELELKGED